MAEGSLTTNITALQTAVSAVTNLFGQPLNTDGSGGSGLAAASGLLSILPGDRVNDFAGSITDQFGGLFSADISSIDGLGTIFSSVQQVVQGSPLDSIQEFTGRISSVDTALLTDLPQTITTIRDAIRGIIDTVPGNQAGILNALFDQILAVLGSMDGPEAQKIQSWLRSIEQLYRVLMPLIQQGINGGNGAELVVGVFGRSLSSTLSVFGFDTVKKLVDFSNAFPANLLNTDLTTSVSTRFTSLDNMLTPLIASANADYATYKNTMLSIGAQLAIARKSLRPVMADIRKVLRLGIFQSGALEKYIRDSLNNALAIEVVEIQRIDDPFKALFDRIDAAIDGIDLPDVIGEVREFFDTLRNTIESVNIGSVSDVISQQLDTVDDTVQGLQNEVGNVVSTIEQYFDRMVGEVRTLLESVGTFQPDGSFRYSFQNDLEQLFTQARMAIGGDPANPDAESLSGYLQQFQSTLDSVFQRLTELLEPVETAVDSAVETAVEGINTFSGYLTALNVPELVEQLKGKVEEIVDALIPIDFEAVVDPVIEEIEGTTETIQSVDTSQLNDLLKEALKLALEVVINIDFAGEIAGPLGTAFDEVKAVPQNAIEQLQRRYEQALGLLDGLKPEVLLQFLLQAFDVVEKALKDINVANLLAPVDALHKKYLLDPLQTLKPSILLSDAVSAFDSITSIVDSVSGTSIIAPLDTILKEVKDNVAALDLTGWVDEIIDGVENVKQTLRDIRPSELLLPLVDEFGRIESQLDRFKPSVVFAPVAELAEPLLEFLETIQAETVEAIYTIFQEPLRILDEINPSVVTDRIGEKLDLLIGALESINPQAHYNRIRASYYDLNQALAGIEDDGRIELTRNYLNPEYWLGDIVVTYSDLITALKGVRSNVNIPDLGELYEQVREKLFDMIPGYARELLDPEAFKRLMRLADPTRFLEELDTRFDALKNKLIPIRPQDIAEELDQTYDTLLAMVEGIEITESLERVKTTINSVKDTVNLLRVDFLAADIDRVLNDLRSMIKGLSPQLVLEQLDSIHSEVVEVVEQTVPSKMLEGLQQPVDRAVAIVTGLDLVERMEQPISEAWGSILDVLHGIDIRIILSPLVDKIDEIEQQFNSAIGRTETAFDGMLRAAQQAMSSTGTSTGVPV